jgi:hypothetical protein
MRMRAKSILVAVGLMIGAALLVLLLAILMNGVK